MSTAPRVGLSVNEQATYPSTPPFDPDQDYPELRNLPGGAPPLGAEPNSAYALVRESLLAFGLDEEHAGTTQWNPFVGLVPRSGLVVIKPNLVLEYRNAAPFDHAIVTHGSVIRPLIDYIRLAGGAEVEILIGDVPLQGADFNAVVEQNGLRATVEALRARGDARVTLLDLRKERAVVDPATGFISELQSLPGDPRGYLEIDVAAESRLEGLPPESFESFAVVDYVHSHTVRAHAPGAHRYLMPASVMQADLVINVPKLKTHQKAGLTVAIKNLVGINGDKARIPHFRLGPPQLSGDEFPPDSAWLRGLQSRVARLLQGRSSALYKSARWCWRAVRRHLIRGETPELHGGATTLVGGGAWHGNDTLWRALHDLNTALLFADRYGTIQMTPQRAYLCVVDGIMAGEGDGPLFPIPRREGVVIVGDDPLAVDLVAARYMWLDWQKMKQLSAALLPQARWTRVCAPVEHGGVDVRTPHDRPRRTVARRAFRPAPGWVGHLEIADPPADG